MAEVFHYRGTKAEVVQLLRELVSALAGRTPDPHGVARGVQLRIGQTFISKVQTNFIRLSHGEPSDAGYTWKPLERATIAQRRVTGAERKALDIGGRRVRGLLTPAEDKRWRMIFGTRLAWLLAKGVGIGEAKAIAAQMAWATLKSEGAKTKLEVLGGRKVDIGRDTGRLFRSLTPGVDGRPSGEAEQIMETPPGAVIAGSNVPYAGDFHKDRPLWPEELPDSWWEPIRQSAFNGIVAAAMMLLQRGRRR